MRSSIKITLFIVLGIAIVLAMTNPTNKDFEEKIPTLPQFNRYVKYKECLVFGRKENYIFFSVYEITNNCIWEDGYDEPSVITDKQTIRPSKTYIGFLKSFY